MIPPTLDRIEILGLRAVGTIGVLPEEQERPQPFEIDIVLEVDTSIAGRTDDLDRTVDYGVAVELATKIVQTEQALLVERVAERIAEDVLELARVHAVEVAVRKLRPPLPHDLASTGVKVRRRRSDLVHLGRPSVTAFVAIGTNLGERKENLQFAVRNLPDVVAVSGVYETEPIGGPEQGAYLNMVAQLDTQLTPFELLETCLSIEAAAGRVRDVRWGPRVLDLDVLLWSDAKIESERLTVPHPRMWERRFVLAPLGDLAPDRLPEDWEQRLPTGGVTRVDDLDY